MLNILVACKEPRAPGGLEHAGSDWRIHYDTSPGWANAANALLDAAAEHGGDALFLDDDTALTAASLAHVWKHYADADVFGLDLHDLSGQPQQGARHVVTAEGALVDWIGAGPAYVAHVSTSAVYLKASALTAGLRFPDWPGVHWEDVAFCLEAWLRGLRVLAVPGRVDHAIAGGVGATKRHTPQFWERWHVNRAALLAWCGEQGIMAALVDGRVPIGAKTYDQQEAT